MAKEFYGVTVKGKSVKIPKEEITHFMNTLNIDKKSAIDMWLCDHDLMKNEEQDALDKKAKSYKRENAKATDKVRKKSDTPKTVKIADEKKLVFENIKNCLVENFGDGVEIKTENKLILVHINDKVIKLDIVDHTKTYNKHNP